jgi:hypothetical protein
VGDDVIVMNLAVNRVNSERLGLSPYLERKAALNGALYLLEE